MQFKMIMAFIAAILFYTVNLSAQHFVGLIPNRLIFTKGYVLSSPFLSTNTYRIDNCGKKINKWQHNYRPGLSFPLLLELDLFRTALTNSSKSGTRGGKAGILKKFSWDGLLRWPYKISNSLQYPHHNAIVLPNDHILAIVWERNSLCLATQAGTNPAISSQLNNKESKSKKSIELVSSESNQADIAFRWRAWEQMVQEFDQTKGNFVIFRQRVELIDIKYTADGPPTNIDWPHLNSIDFIRLNNAEINK